MPDKTDNATCIHCRLSKALCCCAKEKPAVLPTSAEQNDKPKPYQVWKTMNRKQRILTALGYVFAAIIAVGSGVSTAAAFVSLNIVSGGAASIIIPVLIFLAGTLMNWYINKNAVPQVLVDMFGRGSLFKGFREDENGKPLSRNKLIAMALGFFFAISVGITNAMLTYSGTFALTAAFGFLAVISPALPAIAAVLAGVTFVCLSALMLKNIADLIKKENILASIKSYLSNMFSFKADSPQNQNKSKSRIIAERVLAIVLTTILLPLTALGLFMTMNAGANGTKAFLLKYIPAASVQVVNIVSKTISLGFALIGRIPFTVKNIFKLINGFFGPRKQPEATPAPEVGHAKLSTTAKLVYYAKKTWLHLMGVLNGAGNGFISIEGGGGINNVLGLIAGIGGAIISWAAGFSNINVKRPKAKGVGAPKAEREIAMTELRSQQPQDSPRPSPTASPVSLGKHHAGLFSSSAAQPQAQPQQSYQQARFHRSVPRRPLSKAAQGVDPLLAIERRRARSHISSVS